jgi:DNA-binding CsgD family transcriptional regulator
VRNPNTGKLKVCPHCGSVLPRPAPPKKDPDERELTDRQREVLKRIARGLTCTEIGLELKISTRTAEFHRMMLLRILRLNSTAALTLYAANHGYI